MKFCSHCENKIKENDKYCEKCGFSVRDEKSSNMENKNRNKFIGISLIVISVFLVVKTFNMSNHIRDLDKQVSALQTKITSVESISDFQENQIKNLLNQSSVSQNYYQNQINSLGQQVSNQQDSQDTFQQQIQNQTEEQQRKQRGYNSCIDRWKNSDGYINPLDENHCKILWLN